MTVLIPGPNDLPEHGIYHGDCRELVAMLPDRSVDFILWDPDYGVGVDYGHGLVGRDEALDFVEEMLMLLRPKSRTGQLVMFWSGSVERVGALLSRDLSWSVSYMGIWYKPNGAGPTGNRLARRFETWFWLKDGPRSRAEWNALPDVLVENRVTPGQHEAVAHPSQKPTALLQRLIRFFTHPGDIVLDPTVGSGSVAVAAHTIGRRYLGFELNEDYVGMARKRLDEAPIQPSLFSEDPGAQLPMFAALEVSA